MVRAVQNDRAGSRRNREGKRDRVRIAKVNIDDEPALQHRFNVRGVPTLLFFSGGQQRDQIVGVAPKKAIVEKLEKLQAPAT